MEKHSWGGQGLYQAVAPRKKNKKVQSQTDGHTDVITQEAYCPKYNNIKVK
jgi:hypothetical protein